MNNENKFNLDFDYNNLIRNTKINDNTINIANLIMNNTFYESPLYDKIEFGNKIDWGYQHSKGSNTYQLSLHSLNMISFLTDAYLVSTDVKYLEKANSILKDWQAYNISNCKVKKNYVWCDHSTSFRTINILYFYLVAHSLIELDDNQIYNIIIEHLDFLSNFPYYSHDNHGIMIDRTLLVSSFVLQDSLLQSVYFNKAYYRLREAFFRDFSKSGVHLENSVDYHCMVKRLFLEIENFLKKVNMSLGSDIFTVLCDSNNYLSYIEKPDHRFPLIGDSSGTQVNKIAKKFDDFIDTTAGISIFQSENKKSPNKSLWLSFICGYGNSNHKHNDDLSILLSNNGYDLFVDAGKYNYNSKDPIRMYCKSISAHNTIQIGNDKKGYDIYTDSNSQNKPHITNFFQNPNYKLVKGINPSYPNAIVERTLILIKSAILIIYDQVNCKTSQTCIQSFNLAPGMTYNKLKNNKYILTNKNYSIQYEQHKATDSIEILDSDRDLPQAVISETFNTLTDIKQIKAYKIGITPIFLTSINLEPQKYKISSLKVNDKERVITLKMNRKNFKFFI